MKKTELLIMAAGMGSRFEGLKQIEPFGPNGESILDFSVYDAKKAGFDRAVIVIKKSIEKKGHQMFTCFDYDYIAFAVSRDVPLVPQEETHGLALGEVQVKDKVDSQYIVGLILPITEDQMQDEKNIQIVEAFASLCEKNGFPLDIYNYEGVLLDKKKQIKSI